MKNDTKEIILYNLLTIIIFIPSINFYLSEIMVKLWNLGSPTTFLYISLYLISFIIIVVLFLKKAKYWLLYLVIITFIILNVYLYGNFEYAFTTWDDLPYNPLYKCIFLCVPLAFFPFFVKSYSKFFMIFVRYCFINILLFLIAFFYIIDGAISFDYMSFSHNALLSSFFLFYYSIKNKKFFLFLISVISLICISIVGSRGALICLLAFFIIYVLFLQNKNNSFKRLMIILFISFVGIFVIINFDSIYTGIFNLLNLNYDNRVFDRIQNSSFFTDKNRTEIYSVIMDSVLKNSFIGNGLFGDRRIISMNMSIYHDGTYSHNVFLEILCEFGLVFGLMLIILFVAMLILILTKSKTKLSYDFILILASCELIKLLFSGSFLESPIFFLMIGLIISEVRSYGKSKYYCSDVQFNTYN